MFSTKNRGQLLGDQEREQLHSYITGILKKMASPLIEVNSVGDHIHILYGQSKNEALVKVVEQTKSSSSAWLKKQGRKYFDFAWQAGYGAFSVSQSHVEKVREYIRGQQEHHRKEDFQAEFRRFCKKNGVPVNERYVWD